MTNRELIEGSAQLTGVHFIPSLTEEYFASKCRLLVLGESHYGDDDPQLTRRVVRDHLEGAKRIAFFTKLESCLSPFLGGDPGGVMRRVAFYNYVQREVKAARMAPTSEDFQASEEGFRTILDLLVPQLILALGWRLYDQTPNIWRDNTRARLKDGMIKRDGLTLIVGRFLTADRGYVTAFISHPSSRGFSPVRWRPLLLDFIEHRSAAQERPEG